MIVGGADVFVQPIQRPCVTEMRMPFDDALFALNGLSMVFMLQ